MELVDLGDERGQDALAELAKNPYLTGDQEAVNIAGYLGRIGDPCAADLLASVVTDTEARPFVRVLAAGELAGLGDKRGLDYLAAFVTHPRLSDTNKEFAREELGQVRRAS